MASAEDLFQKLVLVIPHNSTHSYYQCLLTWTGDKLQAMLVLHGAAVNDAAYKALLADDDDTDGGSGGTMLDDGGGGEPGLALVRGCWRTRPHWPISFLLQYRASHGVVAGLRAEIAYVQL